LPETFADPDRLQLVFANLLTNAIRYSPPESEVVLRGLRMPEEPDSAPSGAFVRFEVSDQGAGIPLEHQASLFEKFYRVPGTQSGGAGLGLFIARGIVQAHGGRIGVESQPDHGATFWFTIPVAPELSPSASPANLSVTTG
jgi:signal transduction histidine kinase